MQAPNAEWEAVLPLLEQLSTPPQTPAAVASAGQQACQQPSPEATDMAASDHPDPSAVDAMCRLLWGAATALTSGDRDLAERNQAVLGYHTRLIERNELLKRLVAAEVASLAELCKATGLTRASAAAATVMQAPSKTHQQTAKTYQQQGAASSSSSSPEGSQSDRPVGAGDAAPAAAVRLSEAVLLPSLQLLTTLGACTRSGFVHARTQRECLGNSGPQQLLQEHLLDGGELHVVCWPQPQRSQHNVEHTISINELINS